MFPRQLVIEKRKYDGSLWGTYSVFVLAASAERFVFWQPRGTYVQRRHGWATRNDHLQFFFPNQWFAISANYGDYGALSHCYCDIIMPWQPPAGADTVTGFVDLELDLHVEPAPSVRVLDELEFAWAVAEMSYPKEVCQGAEAALAALSAKALAWDEPFASLPRRLPRRDLHRLHTSSHAWKTTLAALGL